MLLLTAIVAASADSMLFASLDDGPIMEPATVAPGQSPTVTAHGMGDSCFK